MTKTTTGSLILKLVGIVHRDYVEPDPTTGEAFTTEGRIIMDAAAKLQELQQELDEANEEIKSLYEDLAGPSL